MIRGYWVESVNGDKTSKTQKIVVTETKKK